MKKILIFTFCTLLGKSLADVSIRNVQIQGYGQTEEEPVEEGKREPTIIQCDINSGDGLDEWTSCKWTHQFEDDDENDVFFYCTIANGNNAKVDCSPKKVDSAYYKRIKVAAGSNYCQVIIEMANYYDAGEWTCHVNSALQDSAVVGSTELFVSRQAELVISDPDMEQDDRSYIDFDLFDENARIFSKCRAYHAKPAPEFHWYVNEVSDRFEIAGPDTREREPREGRNSIGEYVEHALDWTPSNFCEDFRLERQCEENKDFDFDLICAVNQGSYYQVENEDRAAKVTVKVKNNSGFKHEGSVILRIFIIFSSFMTLIK